MVDWKLLILDAKFHSKIDDKTNKHIYKFVVRFWHTIMVTTSIQIVFTLELTTFIQQMRHLQVCSAFIFFKTNNI